jgi:nucleoside-diphosphate-sugar epimerase
MPIIITRACNIYGVGDFNKQRLIPGIIEAYTIHKKYTIRNKGEDIREYIHVDDVVSAYQLLMKYAEEKNHHGAFNISSGESYSTIDLFNLIQEILGAEIKHEIKQEKSREIKNQFMDASLLKSETGWVPKNSIEKSLGLVIKWYQEKLKTN